MHYFRLFFIGVSAFFSVGTFAVPKPFVEDFQVANNLTYELVDNRPQVEKTSSKGSSNRQSCEFGIWRVGDEEVVPSRIDYLKSRLQREIYPERLKGAVVIVREYSIFFNQQLSARAALNRIQFNVGVNSNLQDAMTAFLRSFACWVGPQSLGGYELSTNPRAQPVGVVTIRLDLGDTSFESRYNFVPGKDDQHLPIGGTAVIRAVDKLVEKINAAN